MKKIILLIVPALALSACNQVKSEVESCTYNLAKKEKTCELSTKEYKVMTDHVSEADITPQVLGYTRVDGKDYDIMSDGTLVPHRDEAALASAR